MAYTLLNQLTGTEKEGELYLLKVGNYFVGVNDDGTIPSYDTRFLHLEPREAVVFKTKAEANRIRKTINGVPIASANDKLKPFKIKDVCDVYYMLTLKGDTINICKTWDYVGKNGTVKGSFSRPQDGKMKLEACFQLFSLDNYNEFQAKVKEVRLELTNILQKKLIDVHLINTDNIK